MKDCSEVICHFRHIRSLVRNCLVLRVTTTSADRSILAHSTSVTYGLLVILSTGCTEPESSNRLTTEEIRQTFSSVRDDATVQDAKGTRAVNYWCADGTFTNEWSNGTRSGRVIGRWRAINDQRCIVIVSGLREYGNSERCGPIFRDAEQYLSVNPDGSVHGVHTLSPMTIAEKRAHCESTAIDQRAQ